MLHDADRAQLRKFATLKRVTSQLCVITNRVRGRVIIHWHETCMESY
jgi:hypothetical protein